jgi:ribosomal-protein-alanine N-acetyltransferase
MTNEDHQVTSGQIIFRPMTLDDVPAVAAIEQVSFPSPWSERTYRQELVENPAAFLFVAEQYSESYGRAEIVGYVGFWYIVDEVHISTIAIHPDRRREGIGSLILAYALEEARTLGAELGTLEVRESNAGAISLYQAFGFKLRGRRPGYYRDTDEDALVMFKERLDLYQHEAREWVSER